MKKYYSFLIACFAVLSYIVSGCSQNNSIQKIQLTDTQAAQIETIIQHRDEWAETQAYFVKYGVNRMHLYESDQGFFLLTVAYVEDGTGMMEGTQIFVGEQGYYIDGNEFVAVDKIYNGWLAHSVSVDLENMTDEELREALMQAYVLFLSSK